MGRMQTCFQQCHCHQSEFNDANFFTGKCQTCNHFGRTERDPPTELVAPRGILGAFAAPPGDAAGFFRLHRVWSLGDLEETALRVARVDLREYKLVTEDGREVGRIGEVAILSWG